MEPYSMSYMKTQHGFMDLWIGGLLQKFPLASHKNTGKRNKFCCAFTAPSTTDNQLMPNYRTLLRRKIILWESNFNYAPTNDRFQHWLQPEKDAWLADCITHPDLRTKIGPRVQLKFYPLFFQLIHSCEYQPEGRLDRFFLNGIWAFSLFLWIKFQQ